MSELRRDPLTATATVVVGSRQDRPNLAAGSCPFCVGGLEAPEPYAVRWFPNRWPALGDQRCEILLYTPEHDQTFAGLGVAGARRVVELWADRTAALGARDDVAYVLIFENRGAEVGATVSHPHGQIYAYDQIPPVPLQALRHGELHPEQVPPELRVARHGDWLAWVPDAAVWPYELRIASFGGAPDLIDERCDRNGLAGVLVDVLDRLDRLFGEPMPYMMWIHQRPTDGGQWPQARVCVTIAPLLRAPGTQRYVAAAELGGGIYFNPVDPAEAAASLRAVPPPR